MPVTKNSAEIFSDIISSEFLNDCSLETKLRNKILKLKNLNKLKLVMIKSWVTSKIEFPENQVKLLYQKIQHHSLSFKPYSD